jgi:hypothetical protein
MSKLLVGLGAERDSEHPSATVTRTRMNRDQLGLKRLPVDQAGPLSGGCKPRRPNVKPPGTGKFRGNPGPAAGPAAGPSTNQLSVSLGLRLETGSVRSYPQLGAIAPPGGRNGTHTALEPCERSPLPSQLEITSTAPVEGHFNRAVWPLPPVTSGPWTICPHTCVRT